MEPRIIDKVSNALDSLFLTSFKTGKTSLFVQSTIRFVIFGFYAYSFWIGTKILERGKGQQNSTYTSGHILITLFALFSGLATLLAMLPNL